MALAAPNPGRDRLTEVLVLVTIIALAFNDLFPVLPVGELSNDALIYAFPLLLLAILRHPLVISAPVVPILLILALGVSLLIGIWQNYDVFSSAYFKGRSGFGRLATQGLSLGFGLLIALTFYSLTARGFLPVISRGAQIALTVMAAFGVLEIASWFHVPGLSQIHTGLSVIVHAGSGVEYDSRLRTTAFEVSWAGVILTFLFPFALAGIEPKGWRMPFLAAMVLGMALLAQSRTALLVLGSQVIFVMTMLLRRNVDFVIYALAFLSVACSIAFLSSSIRERGMTIVSNVVVYGSPSGREDDLGGENVSNVTRLASIRAGIAMFRERPFFGVGLGQYGFNYPGHLRAEDFRSWEVRKYSTDADEGWPPSFSIHARLLAETGLIGYGLWLGLILTGLLRSLRNLDMTTEIGRGHMAVAMTLVGWLLLGASIDSFRFFGGWMAVGIAYALPSVSRSPTQSMRSRIPAT